jgi:hypothetical protein
MRRIAIVLTLAAAAAGLATWATAATNRSGPGTHARACRRPSASTWPWACKMQAIPPALATKLAAARLATAKYVTDLARAKADGYAAQITPMMANMGVHFLNPKVKGFDVTKPPILVYEKRGRTWQLGAFEWVFPAKPKTPPLPGATYGSFGAACHYVDGTFVFQADQNACATTSPKSPGGGRPGAAFGFWHPDFVTLHLWVWYPNPAGIYSGMNPLVHPFNAG